jgi:serine/threonine-protein kinase
LPETAVSAGPSPIGTSGADISDKGTRLSSVVPSPHRPVADLPAQIGPYRIEGEIGRGGMGVVLRAHDDVFQRSLAVKVVLADPSQRPEQVQRFLEEAQIMGQLQHPGIAPIHTLGWLPDGRPYFGMKLIKGQTLAELLRQRSSPTDELPRFLGIFGQLCQAVAYAHNRGILHRDLKPSNVMVGAFSEVQVMDWGLAKVLGKEQASGAVPPEPPSTIATVRSASAEPPTQAGAVLGTPAYMAPEQARGEVDQLDERCDVFGLGAILCVVLTGKPPYVASDSAAIHRQAARGILEGAYARLDLCGADADLVALARTCLATEREQRPRHTGVVADAVAAYQAQVQEKLHRAEMARAQAQVKAAEERKRRRLTLLVAALLLLLVGGGSAAGWWYQEQQAEHEAERAQQAIAEAERRTLQAVRQEKAVDELKAALKEAGQLHQRARALFDNLPSCQVTLAAAQSAVKRAEFLLTEEPQLAGGELAAQVRRMRAEVEADERDRLLIATLEKVVFRMVQDPLQNPLHVNREEMYQELQKALKDWGLSFPQVSAAQARALIQQRPPGVRGQLFTVVIFSCACAPSEQMPKQLEWLLAVLGQDLTRLQQLQQAVAHDPKALDKIMEKGDGGDQSTIMMLACSFIPPMKDSPALLVWMRRAQQKHPQDFWVNLALAATLYRNVFPAGVRRVTPEELPRAIELLRYSTAAVALRPDLAGLRNSVGDALRGIGDLAGAIASYQEALRLDPKSYLAPYNLGLALIDKEDWDAAIVHFKKALDLDPKSALAHFQLGFALGRKGEVEKEIAAYKKALELEPRLSEAHNNLGVALERKGDLDGAIAAFKKALELNPKHALARNNLRRLLLGQGRLTEARRAWAETLRQEPADHDAWYGYAELCLFLGEEDAYRQACARLLKRFAATTDPSVAERTARACLLRPHPDDLARAAALADLAAAADKHPHHMFFQAVHGLAEYRRGRHAAADAVLRPVADRLRPPMARLVLAMALHRQGKKTEALQALRAAVASFDWDERHAQDVDPWVGHVLRREAEELLLPGLNDLLQGKPVAAQAPLPDLAAACAYRQRFAAAARLYAAAFASAPKLADDLNAAHRYHAACCAARAGAGKGQDAAKLDDKEKTRLRQQALAWLRDNLKEYAKQLEAADAKTRQAVQQTLQHWQKDPDFNSLRVKDALAKLPEAERTAWQLLWAEVETLRKKAATANSP